MHAQDAELNVPPNSKKRVLVVDDNQDAAQMLSLLLTMLGKEVKTANDGIEALQVAAEFLPEVILLDLGMPRMDGYEAARCIRKEAWGKDMVLIALTGWGEEDDKRRTIEAGFDHHLVKPVEPSILEKIFSDLPRLSRA